MDRKRRLMENNNGWPLRSQLFDGAPFRLPLTHTAVPASAASGTTATFTRATTKTWPNNDGYMVTGVAGEIGFVGARRVDNLIRLGAAQSSTLAVAANVTMTLPAGAYQFSMGAGTGTATFSGTGGATGTLAASASARTFVAKTISAGTLIVTASVATLVDIQVVSMVAETDQTTEREYVSVGVPGDWLGDEHVTNGTFDTDTTGWTAKNTGSLYVVAGKLRVTNGVFGGAEQAITTVVGTKYVLSRNFTAGTSTACITQIGTSAGANDLYDSGIVSTANLSAEFTATSTTTYVQVYLGDGTGGNYAGFDNISVKPALYHGSFVDGVKCFPTDISGNPIPSTTLLGYSAEGARTNYALWNRDLTNVAWTKTSCTAALTATGADNAANSASTLTATAGNATCLQSITRVSAQRVTGCKIKRRTGTGTINMTQDNGVTWTPVTVTSAYTNVAIPAATAANPIIGFQIVTNGDAIDIDYVMHEEAAFVSSSIATTTIAVARNADVESVSTSGNITAAAGSVYLEFTPTHSPSGTIAFWGTYVDASNYTAILHDATNLICRKRIAGINYDATIANAFVSGTTYKVCGSWGASGVTVTLNGTEGTPSADTTAAQIAATMQWGADGNSLQQPFASVRNCRDWLRQLSSSERRAITA